MKDLIMTLAKDLKPILLGESSIAMLIGFIFFASVGALIRISYTFLYRNKSANHTPKEFSISYLIWDTLRRYAFMIVCVYVFARFTDEILSLVGWEQYSEYGASYAIYVAIGIGFDYFVHKKVPKLLKKIIEKDKVEA